MTHRAAATYRLAFGLCGPAGIVCASLALAQSGPASPAAAGAASPTAPTAASPATAPAAPSAAAAPPGIVGWSAANLPGTQQYQDRYIGGGVLTPDVSSGDAAAGADDTQGLARSLELDAVASALSSRGAGADGNVLEQGMIAKSQWETAGYGAWSLDASARTGGSDSPASDQGQGGVITLRQRAMPFDGGWQADNGLGDLNSPDIGLARLQSRFYLPTAPMQGLTTEWRGPSDVQIVAGGGVPGLYDGIVVPDFRTLDGSTATAGAQWSPVPNWTLGGQYIAAHDVNLAVGPVIDGSALLSSSTGLASAAWSDPNERVQFNVLDGTVSGKSSALGGWLDGSVTQGRIQQSAGLFRIDPNLTWGNQLITNDVQGGYYRFDYQSRQWLADLGLDEVRSVDALGTNTTFLTGDARYQVLRDWGIGGVANLSRSDGGNAWSLEGYADHLDAIGATRVQADYAATPTGRDTALTIDQAWSAPAGTRLSTGVSLERIDGTVQDGLIDNSTVASLSAYGGGQFTDRFGAEGNVRWATTIQGRAAPGVSANVSLTCELSRQWQILATYYDSRVGSWTPLTVQSPLAPPTVTSVPAIDERGIFLTLRYRRAAGSHFAPLGGAPGTGSGEISGTVYLDANDNGRLDAGEAGAPNVTVVLDGRFSVETDAAGRFGFPVVAAGHHVITVVSDNLPLPWAMANEGRTEIEVATRQRTSVSIGARRLR